MERRRQGFSILELLIVIAVLGVLLAIGFVLLPRDEFQVNQAVEQVVRTAQRARFVSVERNEFVWIDIDATAQTIELRSQAAANDDTNSSRVAFVEFGTGDLEALRFDLDDGVASPIGMLFDARGVGHGIVAGGTYLDAGQFNLTVSHQSSGFARPVAINQYGRSVLP